MIIDADCHLSSTKWDGLAITAPELVAQMDRAGVDKALVWLKPPYNKDIDPENRAIYEAMKQCMDTWPQLKQAAMEKAEYTRQRWDWTFVTQPLVTWVRKQVSS